MEAAAHGRRTGVLHFLVLASFFLVAGPVSAAGIVYSDIRIFGDSLSETGNYTAAGIGGIVYPPPYAPGRFSNGPVWVEYLAADLGLSVAPSLLGGNNYAWGGARTGGQPLQPIPVPPFDIGVQKNTYLLQTLGSADPNALYVVWAGGNDVLASDITSSADNIFNVIDDLSSAGATNFLVPNLPELPTQPLFAQLNSEVDAVLDTAEATLPINLTRLDVNGLFNEIGFDAVFNGGAVFGITNLFDPCFDGATVCADPDTYLSWDSIPHPTTRGHELIGALAFQQLSVPLPAGAWLLVSGLGMLAGVGARRR